LERGERKKEEGRLRIDGGRRFGRRTSRRNEKGDRKSRNFPVRSGNHATKTIDTGATEGGETKSARPYIKTVGDRVPANFARKTLL